MIIYLLTFSLIWQKFLDFGGIDEAHDVAVSPDGYIYVIGEDRKDVILCKLTPLGDTVFTKRFGSSGQDFGMGIAIDKTDTAIISCGGYNGYSDIFLARHKKDGSNVFLNTYNHGALEIAEDVCVDANRYIVLCGWVTPAILQQHNFLVKKLNQAGATIWTNTFKIVDCDSRLRSISCDNTGNYYYTAGSVWDSTVAQSDWIILKFDYNGNCIDTLRWDGGSDDDAYGICVDKSGKIVVVGGTEISTWDIKIMRLSENLSILWERTFDNGGFDCAYGVCVDDNNNIYICGETEIGSESHLFVAKYDSAGNLLDNLDIDVGDKARAYGVAYKDGEIYITGFRELAGDTDWVIVKLSDFTILKFTADFDDTNNFYARKRLYTIEVDLFNVSGGNAIDTVYFEILKNGNVIFRSIYNRKSSDPDSFEILTGAEYVIDKDSCYHVITGDTLRCYFRYWFDWDFPGGTGLILRTYAVDTAGQRTANYNLSCDVDTAIKIDTFYINPETTNIGDTIIWYYKILYKLSQTITPPDSEIDTAFLLLENLALCRDTVLRKVVSTDTTHAEYVKGVYIYHPQVKLSHQGGFYDFTQLKDTVYVLSPFKIISLSADFDDTNNFYARKRLYTIKAQATHYLGGGAIDTIYLEIIRRGNVVFSSIYNRESSDPDSFEILTGSQYVIDRDSCYHRIISDTLKCYFRYWFDWDFPGDTGIILRVCAVDSFSNRSKWDTIYCDVDTAIKIDTFYMYPESVLILDKVYWHCEILYSMSNSIAPPDSEIDTCFLFLENLSARRDTVSGKVIFTDSLLAEILPGTYVYHPQVVLAHQGGYFDFVQFKDTIYVSLTKVNPISPLDSSALNTPTPLFVWHTIPFANYYHLQIATDTLFVKSLILDTAGITDTFFALKDTLRDGIYYWRVRAYDTLGNTGEFSNKVMFWIDTHSPEILKVYYDYYQDSLPNSVIFYAIVRDNFCVDSVWFHYLPGWEQCDTFKILEMQLEDTVWKTPPIIFEGSPCMIYFVRAKDKANNFAYSDTGFIDVTFESITKPEIEIYPTIVRNVINLKLPKNKIARFEIYDLTGRKIKELKILSDGKVQKVNLKYLPAGIYFVKMRCENSERIFKLLVIK